MLTVRHHIILVFVIILVGVGAVHAEQEYTATPAVAATAMPFGGTVVTDEAQTPVSPLIVEATSVNGANSGWAQAIPGRLRASSVIVNAPEGYNNSQGVCNFVDHYRISNPSMPLNTTGDFFFRLVLTGTMRILASDIYSEAMVQCGASTILNDPQIGQLNFEVIDGVATLYADTGNPGNNILAGPGGEMRIYGTTTSPSGGYYEIQVAVMITYIFRDFPINTSPPLDDWKNQIDFRLIALSRSDASCDFSSTFEFAPQNPVVPDWDDDDLPVTGWDLSAASGEIALPAALTVATSTGSGLAAFVSEQGTINNLTALTLDDFPVGLTGGDFADGWFSMDVALLDGESICDLEVTLPAAVESGATWWFHDGEYWQEIALGDDDFDARVFLQVADNGFGDADPSVGAISLVGGISDEAPLPVFLSLFQAEWRSGGVELSWRAPIAEPDRLRLEAYLNDTSWVVPLNAEPGGSYTARDDAAVLHGGGSVRYDLRFDDEVLDSKTVELPGLTASRLGVISPNPFNPKVEIAYIVAPGTGDLELAIHDLRGRRVATLVSGDPGPGRHVVEWKGLDSGGQAVPSGIYLVRLATAQRVESRKISLVR